MNFNHLLIKTQGEKFYDITPEVKKYAQGLGKKNGLLFLYLHHTSCALAINENYDPTAKADMENFLKYLAPQNLSFITHTAEGPDDSPSHLKSLLLQQNLMIPFEDGELNIGTWQGIFLCEFREGRQTRKISMSFID